MIMVLIVIFFIVFYLSKNSNNSFEVIKSSLGSITEKINVTGKVAAIRKAELGFEKGGVVYKINYKVGDIVKIGNNVISLDSSDTAAQYKGAQANLSAEKAALSQLLAGLRPEELSVEGSKLRSAQVNYDDSKIAVINAIHDSYAKVENSIFNYVDSFFENPQSVSPRINIRTENYTQESSVNLNRLLVGESLRSWKSDIDNMTNLSDPMDYLDKVHSHFSKVKILLSQLSTIVSDMSPGNSGATQSKIDSYNISVNSALSTFNAAVTLLSNTEAAYRNSIASLSLTKNQFDLRNAGSSEQAIQIQQAKVDQASANVLLYQTELTKKNITSPIDGVITKIQPELGEFISSGQLAAIIMSDVFKIEVNIPESDIAKVSIGNSASITLDAYDSSVIFNAHVTAIDPAETIVEGVPTYKVTLSFDQRDERVRSGMTANIDIITNTKDGVVIVPYRAIINNNGQKNVRVKDVSGNGFKEIKVKTGILGNDGNIEIVEGLSADVEIIMSSLK